MSSRITVLRRRLGWPPHRAGTAGRGDGRADGRAAVGVRGLGRPGRLPGGRAARDAGLPAQPPPGRAGAGRGRDPGHHLRPARLRPVRPGPRPAGGRLCRRRGGDRRRGRGGPVRGQWRVRRRPARARRRGRPAGPGHPGPLRGRLRPVRRPGPGLVRGDGPGERQGVRLDPGRRGRAAPRADPGGGRHGRPGRAGPGRGRSATTGSWPRPTGPCWPTRWSSR